MNGNNDEYIVLFGNDRYHADLHASTKFDSIKAAREYARRYINAYIFRCHYSRQSGDLISLQEAQ